jgi:hypothetical protein
MAKVTIGELCPTRVCAVFTLAALATNAVAAMERKSWNLSAGSPPAAQAGAQAPIRIPRFGVVRPRGARPGRPDRESAPGSAGRECHRPGGSRRARSRAGTRSTW